MGKFSSSSQMNRPLFLTSLAVSLVLHGGGLYFLFKHPFAFKFKIHEKAIARDLERDFILSETLSHLTIKEEETASLPVIHHPSRESRSRAQTIVSNLFFPLEVEPQTPSKPYSLSNKATSLDLSTVEPVFQKFSAYKLKKPINFSQGLNIEFERLHTVVDTPEGPTPPYRLPKLEYAKPFKRITGLGKTPVELDRFVSDVLFNIESHHTHLSEIVAPKIQVMKHKNPTTSNLQLPETLYQSTFVQEVAQQVKQFTPIFEIQEKNHFGNESLYFFYKDGSSSTSMSLNVSQDFTPQIHIDSRLTSKKHFANKSTLAQEFFGSIHPLDFSAIAEQQHPEAFIPVNEEAVFTLSSKDLKPLTPGATTSPTLTFQPQSTELKQSILVRATPCKADLTHQSTLGKEHHFQLPKVKTYDIQNVSLSRGPRPILEKERFIPIATKLLSQELDVLPEVSVTFAYAKNRFSLPRKSWAPPKQLQELARSAIEIPDAFFQQMGASGVELEMSEMQVPQNEAIASVPFSHELPEVAKIPDQESIIAFSSINPANSPLESSSLDTPHATLPPKVSQWNEIESIAPEIVQQDDHNDAVAITPPQAETHSGEFEIDHRLPEVSKVQPPKSELEPFAFSEHNAKLKPHPVTPRGELSPKVSKWDELETISPAPVKPELSEESLASAEPEVEDHSVPFEMNDSLPKLRKIVPPKAHIQPFAFSSPSANITSTPMAPPPLAHLKTKKQLNPQEIQLRSTLIEQQRYASIKSPKLQPKLRHLPEQEVATPMIPSTPSHPDLALDVEVAVAPSFKKHDFTKHKIYPQESFVGMELPFLEDHQAQPSKVQLKPLHALKGIPITDEYLALVPRKDPFPMTNMLQEKRALPRFEHPPLEEFDVEINPPETTHIQSESKQIIENHSDEAMVAEAPAIVTTPSIDRGMTEHEIRTLNEIGRVTQGYLSEIPLPTTLETISYQNDFDTTVAYVKRADKKGYYFAIKMKPSESLYFASAEKNYIFVLDGSSSIKKHRFNAFKDAVTKSLSYLREGDSYNILVADSEIKSMYQESQAWSKKSSARARNYLRTREYRGFFTKHNAFSLLTKASTYFESEKENIVILITDGNSLGNIADHKEEMKALAENNLGDFSLFAASASKENNLSMLDLVSTFNHGEFMYSPTNASFPRKLAILVKHIESRIAKDIRINTIANEEELDVQFYPNQSTLPALYSDAPFILYGSIDALEDFDIILQGRAGDQWVNIKQHITFVNAEEAGQNLKRNFALQQAYACYDYYLKKDDPFFLAEAERILVPHALVPATR